ncbi:DUF4199 domain-containing protein [Porphyromonas pogonae]|uniref:DUF4199 domain-containing protein n=1 Tax=Porphyromonas pogonae TaxID=867595 RepID=UPI002E792197|nr:DUF4199 domain-containing protein [Porphyromonas pogonae]
MTVIEDKSNLFKVSARLGLVLGLYFILKYLCMLNFFRAPELLSLIYIFLTLMVPVIVYVLIKRYRDSRPADQPFGVMHGWQFGVMLYAFASILVALPHYVFYEYVLPAHIDQIEMMAEQLLQKPGMEEIFNQAFKGLTLTELIEKSMSVPAVTRVFNDISDNLFWGIIISIPIAFMLRKKDTRKQETNI